MSRTEGRAALAWVSLLGDDPLPWLLAGDEPAARWVTLTGVLDRPAHDPQVLAARAAVVADPATQELLRRLPDWEAGERLFGHDSPRFAPNLLNLLADMGVQEGDDPRVGRLLEELLAHQDPSGRFPSFAASRAGRAPVWGALLCDSHAVIEVLVRYGRGDDPRVHAGLARMAADLAPTAQGSAWPCLPHPVTWYGASSMLDALGRYPALWRGPGADPGDRTALAELAACLVAYNAGPDGTVTPGSVWRGFETFSLGQKQRPSPFATARVLAVLHRLDDLAEAAAAVDVRALGSSKGGSGAAVPPRPHATAGL